MTALRGDALSQRSRLRSYRRDRRNPAIVFRTQVLRFRTPRNRSRGPRMAVMNSFRTAATSTVAALLAESLGTSPENFV
jgi:hypothetical protein